VLCCVSVLGSGGASAQEYPIRPIHLVVPFPPGGGADVMARLIGPKIAENWGQQIVVENRPGAAGLVGAASVAKADPNGYTLLLTALGGITKDNIDAFAAVVLVSAPPNVLVVNPDVKANSMSELLAHIRANPGKLTFGSAGLGSLSHLAGELLKSMAKLDITHVPYKGIGQVIGDLLGNHVQLAIAPLAAVESNIKSGRLKALAVTSTSRYAPLPDLPTIAEAGVPGYEAINWFGILAPARVSPPIVAKLNAEMNRVIQLRDVNERLRSIGADPVGGSAAEFAHYIRADTEKWAKVNKNAGIEISR
jgi:tripartite-type tricarboxylate transporter receptor subunit TctC